MEGWGGGGFSLLTGADSAYSDEERRRSPDFIIPKQMVQNETWGPSRSVTFMLLI